MSLSPASSRGGGGGLFDAYALLQAVVASGTGGGDFVSGDWRTVPLNTVSAETEDFVTLAANAFTLPAGTYWIHAVAHAFLVNSFQYRLRRTTATAATEATGLPGQAVAASGTQVEASVYAPAVVAEGDITYELQGICQTSRGADGMGIGAGFGVSLVHAAVEIRRYAA